MSQNETDLLITLGRAKSRIEMLDLRLAGATNGGYSVTASQPIVKEIEKAIANIQFTNAPVMDLEIESRIEG